MCKKLGEKERKTESERIGRTDDRLVSAVTGRAIVVVAALAPPPMHHHYSHGPYSTNAAAVYALVHTENLDAVERKKTCFLFFLSFYSLHTRIPNIYIMLYT